MRRIGVSQAEPLHSAARSRLAEQAASALLAPHQLMARAGAAVAHLARALAPHAQCIWVACGPGNNGGDGLVAATHLWQWSRLHHPNLRVAVTLCAEEIRLPADAADALQSAKAAGLVLTAEPPAQFDLAIDALLGIGASRPSVGATEQQVARLRSSRAPVLCVDVPSGLNADTGVDWGGDLTLSGHAGPRHTLALLTLKPGLFTALGRDLAGQVWFDDLTTGPAAPALHAVQPTAWLNGWAAPPSTASTRPHASHKGSHGDIWVVGGQGMAGGGRSMAGAAILAARAALYAGAGRVFVSLLGSPPDPVPSWDPCQPELMFREIAQAVESPLAEQATVVFGCGAGEQAARWLQRLLSKSRRLVLDADGLNAVANDPGLQRLLMQRASRGFTTVLTPHPLEAARLLGSSTAGVMADRLSTAQNISDRFGAVCVLKGSGTVIAGPGQIPRVNPTGNAALATAGTGDVLAGMLGAALAALTDATLADACHARVCQTVHQHGWLADHWATPAIDHAGTSVAALTAGALARRATPLQV